MPISKLGYQHTTRPPALTPSATLSPGLTLQQRRKNLDSKCSIHFITASSSLILHSYHSQQKTDRAKEQHIQLQHPFMQDTLQIYVILPHSSPMDQPTPGDSGSQVHGLFQVHACCPPVIMKHHPLPAPSPNPSPSPSSC